MSYSCCGEEKDHSIINGWEYMRTVGVSYKRRSPRLGATGVRWGNPIWIEIGIVPGFL